MKEKHRKQALRRLHTTFDRIDAINQRLLEIEQTLKEIQPKRTGTITLYLSDCGKDCLGCPHATWELWRTRKMPKGSPFSPFFSVTVTNPLRRLKRTGDFEESFEQTRSIMQEALKLLEEKAGLVEAVSRLNRRAYSIET
ncbi:MAG: hypothetical protein IBX55_01925 [Methyloprofundus sp.]|nr:hypothetical protein [Methyloprofundus sp.]